MRNRSHRYRLLIVGFAGPSPPMGLTGHNPDQGLSGGPVGRPAPCMCPQPNVLGGRYRHFVRTKWGR
ncbi:hypothetical protein HMPREF1549_00832 [Actinomyces johnsonii F0510]|uniref:Uncharacterized protein n=1 Tax=Actinomyces johnsonii F0510 TaxID=1227262 RepID=U1PZ71_9ACTO|nr:hypothetical protein HMPREF1549_00832 [Actinomyces johnsonii F0510]